VRQRHPGTVTVLVLAAALTGCGPGDGTDRETEDPPYAFGPGDEYVALGDSYTAAPNTGPYVARDGCFQTRVNYPHRVAEETGMTLVDNSCSGASTNSLTHPQVTVGGPHRPQLTGLDEDTDLVTIRMGANDYAMFARIIHCARLHDADEPGSPCTDLDAASGDVSIDARLEDLEDNLVRSFTQIKARAPEARVIAIGYPRIFPASGTCDLLPLPAGDYDFARRLNEGLNDALETAADRVGDVEYLDVFSATEDHDICSDDPWIAGVEVVGQNATPWHPYPEESQAVAEMVLEELE